MLTNHVARSSRQLLPATLIRLLPLTVLLLLCLPALVINLTGYPAVWFDEGFKMNAARLFAEQGIYGSRSAGGVIPFDIAITSGPLEIGAMALGFRLFGADLLTARVIMALFCLVVIGLIYSLLVVLSDHMHALIATLGLLALPPFGDLGILLIGRQVLNETPAMLMVLLGVWLLYRSWQTQHLRPALFAGLSFGIALLSKSQFGIALLPTLLLIGLLRWRMREDTFVRAAAPAATMLAVFALWSAFGRLLPFPEVQAYNSEMLWMGLQANLLTTLFGSTLTRPALLITAVVVAAAAYGAWRVWRAFQAQQVDARIWLIALLTTLALLNTVWFAFVSVGWPRYAYLGFIPATMLLGLAVADLVRLLSRKLQAAQATRLAAAITPMALTALAAGLVIGHILPPVTTPGEHSAEAMADYIARQVPREAVIETWAWELSALGPHTRYHFPHQRYVYIATGQFGRAESFTFDYDLLRADPDYLLAGPFSDWTGLYPADQVMSNFTPETQIGPYLLYRRIR